VVVVALVELSWQPLGSQALSSARRTSGSGTVALDAGKAEDVPPNWQETESLRLLLSNSILAQKEKGWLRDANWIRLGRSCLEDTRGTDILRLQQLRRARLRASGRRTAIDCEAAGLRAVAYG